MKVKEIIIVTSIVILGYLIAIFTNSRFLTVMNVSLSIFYGLFISHRLPDSFYNDGNFDNYTKYSIFLVIFFLITMDLWFFVGDYKKFIGRIGLCPLLLYTIGIMIYALIKKVFTNMSMAEFKHYIWIYSRGILIIVSNIAFIIFLPYSYQSKYVSGKLQKEIHDGADTYLTTYNDSLSMYQTRVHIEDSKPEIDYIIYYDEYPNKINHVDTLSIGR